MEPLSGSSSYSKSTSQSEELSSMTDSLGSIEYKIGRVQKEQLGTARKEVPPGKRTRSFSHFSLKKQFHKSRTVSDNTLLGETRKERIREKFSHLRNRIRSLRRDERPPQPDEYVQEEDLKMSGKGMEVTPFSKDEAKVFLVNDSSESMDLNILLEEGGLPVDFDGPLQNIILNFLEVEEAKQEACKLNAQMLKERDDYRAEKKELQKKLEDSTSVQEKKVLEQRLGSLRPIKGKWIRNKNGNDLKPEQLKLLREPRLHLYLPKKEQGICLATDFIFSVLLTDIQFVYRKEGHLKYEMDGLLVMNLETSLQ